MRIYLAIPYSDTDPKVREQRFETANRITAWLYKKGFDVYSPITHSHPVAKYLPDDYHTGCLNFWINIDRPFMDWADQLLIVDIEGIMDSPGVKEEYNYMVKKQGKTWAFVREHPSEGIYLTVLGSDLF